VENPLSTKSTQRITLFDSTSVGSRVDSIKGTPKVAKTPVVQKKPIGLTPGLPKPIIKSLKKVLNNLPSSNGPGEKPASNPQAKISSGLSRNNHLILKSKTEAMLPNYFRPSSRTLMKKSPRKEETLLEPVLLQKESSQV
jgi:hypothetical protein